MIAIRSECGGCVWRRCLSSLSVEVGFLGLPASAVGKGCGDGTVLDQAGKVS